MSVAVVGSSVLLKDGNPLVDCCCDPVEGCLAAPDQLTVTAYMEHPFGQSTCPPTTPAGTVDPVLVTRLATDDCFWQGPGQLETIFNQQTLILDGTWNVNFGIDAFFPGSPPFPPLWMVTFVFGTQQHFRWVWHLLGSTPATLPTSSEYVPRGHWNDGGGAGQCSICPGGQCVGSAAVI